MPRTPVENLIPKADKLLIRAFPKVAQLIESEVHNFDRAQIDAYLKLLPGAVERFQAVVTPQNDLHETVEGAILQLVTSFKPMSFESRTAATVDLALQVDTRNTSLETGETVDGASDSELPNGSDTDQSVAPMSLSRNELAAPAGNSGEPDSLQASPRNPRVRTTSKLQGKRARGRARQASGESADDRGRLSESEGGSNAKG